MDTVDTECQAEATRGLLLSAGLAGTSLIAPNLFDAVYRIDVGPDVNLINELQAELA